MAETVSPSSALVDRLRTIVGRRGVKIGDRATRPYVRGFRSGGGTALAVVRPTSLVELWRVFCACIDAGVIVIVQAANTGLTGGSTPADDGYDRDVVIISTLALDGIHPIDGGRQVVCLAGSTLNRLETLLAPLDREPHSVIGSSCIGASVVGGVCNNSGGSLVRRGPAYTELALFAQVGADGRVTLVNHLGIDLPAAPEAALARVERGDFAPADIRHDPARRASDSDYARRVRAIDDDAPARFNADPRGLHEASGCAGKLCVFAVRLDTFARDRRTRTYYIGTNDPDDLTRIRRTMLAGTADLPVAAEYLNRESFDVAAVYGKDVFLAIRALGTHRLPMLLRTAARFDALAQSCTGVANMSDRLLQWIGGLAASHLPGRMLDFRNRFEHHLLLKVADDTIAPTEALLASIFPSATGDVFTCTEAEARDAFLHRFVTAGAAVRYRNVHRTQVEDVLALDVALRRDDTNWLESLPSDLAAQMHHRLYYGHFFCHVLHQDYILKRDVNAAQMKSMICAALDRRGAEYPAEHNVGHSYAAKRPLREFYQSLDPSNSLNPGIGNTSKREHWIDD